MANTSVVYARIDKELKENAEDILSQLSISPSSTIQNEELMHGVESMKSDKTYTADEVDAELKKEFGI